MTTRLDVGANRIDRYARLYELLHQHPELPMQEHRTASLIEDRLRAIGIDSTRCGTTGVIAVLRNGEGPVVMFRADMDALPLLEETGLAYASIEAGTQPDGTSVPVMHGCGHDAHVACALAAADFLQQHHDRWSGTVVFVFQPGEELLIGASTMIGDGLWDLVPRPDTILAQHVAGFAAGTVQTRAGSATSISDSWRITIHGRGGHGSFPERTVDPIVTGAYTVTRLQAVVARHTSPLDPVVITVGSFTAGLAPNVIPDTAELTINVRTPSHAIRERVLADIRRVVAAEADAAGADVSPTFTELSHAPACINDPSATEDIGGALRREFGADAVCTDRPLSMASEDFGRFADSIDVPSVFWWFGGYSPSRIAASPTPLPGNHSPRFAPDVIPTIDTGARAALAAILNHVGTPTANDLGGTDGH
jgi:amidohydrolase